MKTSKLHIENFRSIKDITVRLNELTAIVGDNNSGKTAILRALNCFFNFDSEEKDFRTLVHKYGPRTKTKIRGLSTKEYPISYRKIRRHLLSIVSNL